MVDQLLKSTTSSSHPPSLLVSFSLHDLEPMVGLSILVTRFASLPLPSVRRKQWMFPTDCCTHHVTCSTLCVSSMFYMDVFTAYDYMIIC